MKKELQTAASWYAKNMKKGGFITSDENIFEATKEGKIFATSHASSLEDKEVVEFDEQGQEVTQPAENELRDSLIESLQSKYSKAELGNMGTEKLAQLAKKESDPGNQDGDDDNEIDLDKMNKAQLIKTLAALDPTEGVEKHTKAKTGNDKLKDLIEAANSLIGFESDKLRELALKFGAEEQELEGLEKDDLKAIVLNKRDGVELPENVQQKLTGDGNQ
jgi:hypothetical protein